MDEIRHQVIIAGGGPTGLMLAGELALAGVDVAIVERRANQEVEGSRAGGLHSRSIEILDQRGIADRFISKGAKHPVVPLGGAMLDGSDRPSRHNYTLGLWQAEIERGLAEWIVELGVTVHRGAEVADFAQDEGGVEVELGDGRRMRADYLVGCDGGRSLVRKKAGIDFPGWDADLSYLIFEGEMAGEPELGVRHGEKGICAIGKLEDGARVRGVVAEPRLETGDEPSLDELRAALVAAYGSDYGVHDVTWLSRFTDAARQAASYRSGRVLLAGDAAHVHSPVGGQGLNVGIQDSVNLGWKLAQVVKGISPDDLLDTYHAERHPVGAALLDRTLALTALHRGDARSNALRRLMVETMQIDAARRWYVAMISGLDIRYAIGEGHKLLGRHMPDLDIVTAQGPTRVFELLHDALPVLLDLGDTAGLDLGGWAGRVKRVRASYEGSWELIGEEMVEPPTALLIRPDGHIAWVGVGGTEGLEPALEKWFGRPEDAAA